MKADNEFFLLSRYRPWYEIFIYYFQNLNIYTWINGITKSEMTNINRKKKNSVHLLIKDYIFDKNNNNQKAKMVKKFMFTYYARFIFWKKNPNNSTKKVVCKNFQISKF